MLRDWGQRSYAFKMEADVVHKELEQNHVVEPPLASVAEMKEETEALVSEPAAPNNLWIKKYLILKSKCDQIDQSNDVLYAKSRQIYNMIQRAEAEKKVLMRRLERYELEVGEGHSAAMKRMKMTDSVSPPPISLPPSTLPASLFTSSTMDPGFPDFVQLHQDMVLPPFSKPDPPILTSLPSSPSTQNTANHHPPPPPPLLQPSKRTQPSSSSSSSAHLLPPTALPTPAPKSTKTTKRTPKGSAKRSPASRRKKDTDSNAPKKPSNAFFWFCQEQRGSMEERFRGEGVAGQHTLTKILAQKWGETSADDKKKYYLKYTDDKKRYEREMQIYQQKKQELMELQQHNLSAIAAASTSGTA